MRRIAVTLTLIASPALAQTTNTNCQYIGTQVYCRSTTTPAPAQAPPFNPVQSVQQGYDLADRLRQQPRTKPPAPGQDIAAQLATVHDYANRGECAQAIAFARGTGNPAILDIALGCAPAK